MRISYPGHDAQQGSATVGISVQGPDGTPLKGAVINGRVTYDGEQPAQMSVDLGGTIDVEITHFGQTVASRALTEDDFDSSGTLPTIEIRADEAGYPPGGFGNSLQAVWLSERNIALAWRGRLTTAGDVLRTSVVTDITQRELLFNETRLRYDNDGLEIYSNVEFDSDQGAESEAEYEGRSVGVTHVWTSGREDDGYVKIDTLTFESDPEIAAVRLFNSSGAPDGPAQEQGMTKGSHVNTPSSLSLSVGPETPAAGSKVAVQARTENFDFTPVTWSVSGDVSIVENGSYGCVLEVGENGGGVTATAVNATLTASETISTFESSTLPSPPGLQVSGASQVGEARVSWDDPSSSLVAGTRLSFDGWVWDTTDRSFTVAELPDDTFDAKLRFLNRKGEVGNAASFTLEPGKSRNKPAVYQTAGIPEVILAPGGSTTVDLTQYATPAEGVSWSNLSSRVRHLKAGFGLSATTPGEDAATVNLSLDAAAQADSDVRDIVLVELEDTTGVGARLVQLAFPVGRGSATGRGDALSLGGDSLAAVGGKTAPTGPIVGPDPVVYSEPDWDPGLSSVGQAFEVSLGEGTFTLPSELDGDANCAIAALKGEKGVSVFCFGLTGPPYFAAPLLPSGTIDQVERPDGYISYSDTLLSPGGGPQRWARALTGGGSLHDLSLLEPPAKVTYKAPLYFQSTWIDEHLYPEDASIDYDNGFVTYRQGLQSPAAAEVSPDIGTLRAEPADGGIDVYWDIEASGTPVNGLVSLTVDDSAGNTFSVDGDGQSELRGLDPTKTYTVTLLGQSDSAVPGRERPDLGIEAWTRSDLSYSYRYDSSKSPDAFVDHFGTEHSSPTFPIEVTSEKAVREHVVTFKWSAENKEIREPADWTLPPGGTSIESEVTVGRKLPAGNVDAPTFYRARYSGAQTARLPTDFYGPGTWRIEPVGYLPLGLDEELEDYVRVWFVGPGGEDLGAQTTIDAQAELGARAEIQAAKGQSPIIVGARALRLNKSE